MQSSPKTVEKGGISATGWLLSCAFLLLLISVLLVLNRSENVLREAEKERGLAEAREKLQLDLKLLQKSAVTEIHLGSFLYQQMAARSGDLRGLEGWHEKLNEYLNGPYNPIAKQVQWLIFGFEKSALASETMLAEKRLVLKGKRGQHAGEYEETLRFLSMKGVQTFSNLNISHEYRKREGAKLSDLVDARVDQNQTDFIRSALGCFQKIYLNGRPFYLAWFPLFDRNWLNSTDRFQKLDLRSFDSRNLSLLHLTGTALFIVDEKDFAAITAMHLKNLIRANFAETGCEVIFRPVGSDLRPYLVPDSASLSATSVLTLDKKYAVIVRRASEFVSSSNRLSRFIGFSVKLTWLIVGLIFWGNFFWLRRKIGFNLSIQLTIFTLWMLFPAFYLGFNATERYVFEKQTSAMAGLKKALNSQVKALDSSVDLYKTWVCDVLEKTIVQNAGLIVPGEDKNEEKHKLLQKIKSELVRNGVFSKNIFIVDGSGRIISNLFGADKGEKRFFEEFFKTFYQPVISSEKPEKLPGDARSKGSQLLASAQTEELVEIARGVLLPEDVSAMALETVSLDRLTGMGQQSFIYHKYPGKGKKAFLAVQVGIYMQSVERNCLLDWSEFFKQTKLEKIIWLISRKRMPSWLLRSPFWKANSSGESGQLSPVLDFLSPKLLFLGQLLQRSNISMTSTMMFGGEEYLFVSLPGTNMIDYRISAMLPLGDHRKMLADFRYRLLWAMAIIFLLSAMIGVGLARSFIEPVRIFAANAGQIMTGNFKVRMSENWEEQEFVALAENFNQIVANLDTGKTLTKFVSDGALELIRDQSSLVRDCETVEQAVMFLRLDQFWEKAEKLSPEQAVFVLNSFFSLVCRQIKAAGGDVSKFIGEKALAVFRPDASGSYAHVGACALKIQKMVNKESDRYNQCRVRIGISLGSVLSGIIGDEKSLLEQTVIGDSVNLASRLCTIKTKEQILVNQAMAKSLSKSLPKAILNRLPEQEVKGKKSPVTIFSLAGYTAS